QLWVITPDSDLQGFLEEMKPIVSAYYRNATDPNASVESAHCGRVTNETLLAARRHRVRSSMDLMLFFRAVGALHTTCILVGADLVAELGSFFVQHSKERTRRQLREAVMPNVLASAIRDRVHTEVRLSQLLSRVGILSSPALARARVGDVGYVERAVAVALMTIAIVAAASSAVSQGSAMGGIAAGVGALVLVA